MAKAVEGIVAQLRRFINPPWKWTGPVSSVDYKTHLWRADSGYRLTAPGSATAAVKVPWAEADKMYDIKYWERDARRMSVQGMVPPERGTQHGVITAEGLKEIQANLKDPEVTGYGMPNPLSKATRIHINQVKNDGYE